MDLSIKLIYNGYFFLIIPVWFYLISHKDKHEKFRNLILNLDAKYFYSMCLAFFIPSFLFMIGYGLHYTDVDNAISSGAIEFLNGHNVYIESVVEHMPKNVQTFSIYHYFPADLLFHALIYVVLGQFIYNLTPFLNTYWFAIGYLPLLPVSIYLFKQLINLPWKRSLIVYVMFFQAVYFNNAFLTVTLFMLGLYLIHYTKNYHLGIIVWIFSSSSKYITGIFVFFYFINDVKKYFANRKTISEKKSLSNELLIIMNDFKGYIIGSALFVLLMIPFGVKEVLSAVFLYQGNISERSEVAEIEGPILVELLKYFNLLNYYMPLFLLLIVLLILVVLLKMPNKPYLQSITVATIIMLLFPYIGTELYATPLFGMFFVLLNDKFASKVE